jgi:hypothetical protein
MGVKLERVGNLKVVQAGNEGQGQQEPFQVMVGIFSSSYSSVVRWLEKTLMQALAKAMRKLANWSGR